MKTYAYGFPRLGPNREYKTILEKFWKKEINEKDFIQKLIELQKEIECVYQKNGIDDYPTGEMTLYDKMLDMAVILGIYTPKNLEEYYEYCFGKKALELRKWFNTNYHYLVVDFSLGQKEFNLNFDNFVIKNFYLKNTCAHFIGPFSFLKLSKNVKDFVNQLDKITDVYIELLSKFDSVHLDEPAFVLDLSKEEIKIAKRIYQKLTNSLDTKIYLFTYYESFDFIKEFYDTKVAGIGIDLIDGIENLELIKKYGFPENMILFAGLVDSRGVFKTNFEYVKTKLKILSECVADDKIIISNAAPLFHLPYSIKYEKQSVAKKFCFALERLEEIKRISNLKFDKIKLSPKKIFNKELKLSLFVKDYKRQLPYSKRIKIQRELLKLPLFPTTTIGSFPQTEEVRRIRKEYKLGKISTKQYYEFLESKIKQAIQLQEELNFNVLVHGEYERSDMVEFFAEEFKNFLQTENGWVLSYGSRVYKPPIILSEKIKRKKNITKKWILFAKSLTEKPVKGIYTGPITIIKWSFADRSLDLEKLIKNISLCIKEDVEVLIKSGIKVIQIDEPAFVESLPLKKRKMNSYLTLLKRSFNYLIKDIPAAIQVHFHICYSDYTLLKKILPYLEFDVISLEVARSKGEIFDVLNYKDVRKDIGVGCWDIHSHVVPTVDEMLYIVDKAIKNKLPIEKIWLNPDCGLKTRSWQEVEKGLKNISQLAEQLRKKYIKEVKM